MCKRQIVAVGDMLLRGVALVSASAWLLTTAAPSFGQPVSSPTPTPAETVERARLLAAFLWGLLLLVVVFLTGLFIMRALQRARQRMDRERAAPTEYSDVWTMHRTPDDMHEDD